MQIEPRKALNKAFLKIKPNRSGIELFKQQLIQMLLENKVCVIVGAASLRSIGYATAELFAAHGAKLVILEVPFQTLLARLPGECMNLRVYPLSIQIYILNLPHSYQ